MNEIDRAVMADRQRPCLYSVAGPCFHPRCLEAHYETLRQALDTTRNTLLQPADIGLLNDALCAARPLLDKGDTP